MLLGLRLGEESDGLPTGAVVAGAVFASVLPDLDMAVPVVLDRLGVQHRLNSGRHHSWVTHTPLFWGLALAGTRRLSRAEGAPEWAPQAARVLSAAVVLHLTEDTVSNTVALLWPLRRREYGLSLDRMPEVDDHYEYLRRYGASPAGWLEGALIAGMARGVARRLRGAGSAQSAARP